MVSTRYEQERLHELVAYGTSPILGVYFEYQNKNLIHLKHGIVLFVAKDCVFLSKNNGLSENTLSTLKPYIENTISKLTMEDLIKLVNLFNFDTEQLKEDMRIWIPLLPSK